MPHIVALLEHRLFELLGENVPVHVRLFKRPWEWVFLVAGVRFQLWDPGASRGAPVEVSSVCVYLLASSLNALLKEAPASLCIPLDW